MGSRQTIYDRLYAVLALAIRAEINYARKEKALSNVKFHVELAVYSKDAGSGVIVWRRR